MRKSRVIKISKNSRSIMSFSISVEKKIYIENIYLYKIYIYNIFFNKNKISHTHLFSANSDEKKILNKYKKESRE